MSLSNSVGGLGSGTLEAQRMTSSWRMRLQFGFMAALATALNVSSIAVVLANDAIRTIALSGRPLPGFGNDIVTHSTTFRDAVLNNHGQVAYSADLTGPGIEPKNRESYWRY